MSKISFYIPKDTTVPTDLRLQYTADNGRLFDVLYERIDNGFRFDIYPPVEEENPEIYENVVEDIIDTMIDEHDESQYGVTWETVSLEFNESNMPYEIIALWKYRVRDSY